MSHRVTVQYFAAARDLAGVAEEQLELGAQVVAQSELLQRIAAARPRLGALVSRMRLALNDELCDRTTLVRAGDRVAVLPPVAGGSSVRCSIVTTPLSVDEAIAAVSHAGAGGVSVFLGIVRDHASGKPVARLDYEAHQELAIKEMTRICEQIARDLPGVRLCVVHRVGRLAVGDGAIVIAASAPHRGQAFEACRRAIDLIKETVPIWKKEWGPDGAAHWVNLEG